MLPEFMYFLPLVKINKKEAWKEYHVEIKQVIIVYVVMVVQEPTLVMVMK
jgi:hypothetical protein